MTTALSAVDAIRSDSIMTSLDDNQIQYVSHFCHNASSSPPMSSTDWKTKYYEVADMLAETRAELDEFHTSSKELEDELIKEIERTEKAQQDLKVKVSRVETERDEWKVRCLPPCAQQRMLSVFPVQVHVLADYPQHNDNLVAARVGYSEARVSETQGPSP